MLDVKLLAMSKKFDVHSPNLDIYYQCTIAMHEEKIKLQEIKAEKKLLLEKKRADRKKTIDKLLEEKNIENITSEQLAFYNKYIQNSKTSLNITINNIEILHIKLQKMETRRKKLNLEMKKYKYNTSISDDPNIDVYIIDNKINFEKCVGLLLSERKKYRR